MTRKSALQKISFATSKAKVIGLPTAALIAVFKIAVGIFTSSNPKKSFVLSIKLSGVSLIVTVGSNPGGVTSDIFGKKPCSTNSTSVKGVWSAKAFVGSTVPIVGPWFVSTGETTGAPPIVPNGSTKPLSLSGIPTSIGSPVMPLGGVKNSSTIFPPKLPSGFVIFPVTLSTVGANLILSNSAPANSTANGLAGEVKYDTSYLYICVSNNTWKRITLESY